MNQYDPIRMIVASLLQKLARGGEEELVAAPSPGLLSTIDQTMQRSQPVSEPAIEPPPPQEDAMKPIERPTGIPLIDAIIHVESRNRAGATSPAGAKGLMQLMDATGKELLAKLGKNEPYNPYDPIQNVELGSAYVKEMINRFGDIKLALAAYNAGPGTVSTALDARDAASYEEIKDLLPEETQAYVGKVLEAYNNLA